MLLLEVAFQTSYLSLYQLYHTILVVEQIEWWYHLSLVNVLQRDAAIMQIFDVAKEWLEVNDVNLLSCKPVLSAENLLSEVGMTLPK